MSRWIDGNALIMHLYDWWYSSFGQKENERSVAIREVADEVEKCVAEAPSIDLVFCEECIHSDWHKDINGEWRCYCTEHGSGGHKAGNFCSYGERKERVDE